MKLDFISKWDFNRFIERKQGAKRKCAQLDGHARENTKMLLNGLIFNQYGCQGSKNKISFL